MIIRRSDSRRVRAMALTALLLIGAPLSIAETAPDDFRHRMVTATLVCYGVFNELSTTEWPDRDEAEAFDLRRDARHKSDFAMEMIKLYSAAYDGFDIDEQLRIADRESGVHTMEKEKLLDMAIYCENKLAALVEEQDKNGYTP